MEQEAKFNQREILAKLQANVEYIKSNMKIKNKESEEEMKAWQKASEEDILNWEKENL